MNPVSSETSNVNPRTRQSRERSSVMKESRAGFRFRRSGAAQATNSRPAPPARHASTMLSVRICRMRRRPKQQGVDEGENRGVCADAEPQGQHGNGGEARIFQERSKGVAKIFDHVECPVAKSAISVGEYTGRPPGQSWTQCPCHEFCRYK